MSRRFQQVTAIAWYSPEQWKLLKRHAADASVTPLLLDHLEYWAYPAQHPSMANAYFEPHQ